MCLQLQAAAGYAFCCGSSLSCCRCCCISCFCCCCWHVNVLRLLHRVWPLLIATPQPKLFAIFTLCFVLFSTVGHRSVSRFFLCSSFCFCFPLTADHCKKGNACGYALNCCQFLSSYLSFSLFFLGCTSFFLLLPTHIIELGPVVREKENVNYLNLRKTEPEKV